MRLTDTHVGLKLSHPVQTTSDDPQHACTWGPIPHQRIFSFIKSSMVTDLRLLFHAHHSVWGRTQLQRMKFRSEFVSLISMMYSQAMYACIDHACIRGNIRNVILMHRTCINEYSRRMRKHLDIDTYDLCLDWRRDISIWIEAHLVYGTSPDAVCNSL